MTRRPSSLFGAKATGATGLLCVAALFCVSACADLWEFDDLRGPPDGAGTGGSSGGVAGMGAGGSMSAEKGAGGVTGQGGVGDAGGTSGTGGASGEGGAKGAGGSSGSGGASGSGGGVGGRAGVGGRGGVGGGGAGGKVGTGGAGVGGAGVGGAGTGGAGTGGVGTGGRAGTGGAGGTGVCAAGTNRCVGGDLQTCSSTGIWQSTGTSTQQLLANPGFEAGATGWTTSVAGGFALIYVATGMGNNSPDVAAQSPPDVAWFGGYNNADDIASQSVVIPADATSINVSFFYAIVTRENGTAANDVMDVTVTAGAQTTTLAHFSNANAVATWTRFSAPLPTTLAGQTVRLQFRDLTNNNSITSFYVDTVALQVVACP